MGKHHIIATNGRNIITNEVSNITASKIVCKKDEKILVLFEFDIELLYGRCPNGDLR